MSKKVFCLEDFNYDNEVEKIISCPQGNICIESKYVLSKRYFYARFKAEQCINCDFIKQCPIRIKNKYSIARIFRKLNSDYIKAEYEDINEKYSDGITMISRNHDISNSLADRILNDTFNDRLDLKKMNEYEKVNEKYLEFIRKRCKKAMSYYYIGKRSYISGDFEKSDRAYQKSFELGKEPFDLFAKHGRTVLEIDLRNGRYESVIWFYETQLSPFTMKTKITEEIESKLLYDSQCSEELKREYENNCIIEVKSYLNI